VTPFGNVRASSDWTRRIGKSSEFLWRFIYHEQKMQQINATLASWSRLWFSVQKVNAHYWRLLPEYTLKESLNYSNGTPCWTKAHTSVRYLVDAKIKTTEVHAPVVPRRPMGSCSSNLVTKSLASSGGASSSLGHSITPSMKTKMFIYLYEEW